MNKEAHRESLRFSELVNIGELRELFESFTTLTDAATAILDLEGSILVATGWQDICTRFHRVNPKTVCRCLESDTVLAGQLKKGERYNMYKCKNGLVDVAFPITVGGEHVANFFSGQFLFEPPDMEFFSRQAEESGFDKTAYLDALSRVPIYSEDQVKAMMDFFSRLARLIGEMGLAGKRLEEANVELRKYQEHLEELVRERTAELIVAKERAESASRAKSAFLANMSHELRTPMSAILGYSQLMQRVTSLSPVQKEYLHTINRSGEHLLALINEVLEISKIEARQITVKEAIFDLHALLHDLKIMFRVRTDAKGLQLKVTGIDKVPRYIVSDENKLRQILINLMGNAVKYTETGGITVRAAMEGMRFIVEVEDTGYGIAADEMGKVFQYFEQTESGRKSKTGTGLGLAISREYARMMGGDITVTSTVNKGSTFRFEVPISAGNESDMKEKVKPRRVIGLEPGQDVPRIIVAEDVEEGRALLTTFLTSAGFQVREAANGKEAVEIFEQWHPHLIWMDIRMPVMDGLEATRHIKETEAGKSTIVVALTAHALEEEKQEILSAGCDDFVRKPFRVHDIFAVMAKHLRVRYVYEEEHPTPVDTAIVLKPEQLAALPPDLLNQLRQTVVELDTARTLELIGQIAEQDTSIGNVLHAFAMKLDYGSLLNLLEIEDTKGGGTL